MREKLKINLELEKTVELDFTHEIIAQNNNKKPFFFNDDYLFTYSVSGQVMIFELKNLEKIGALEFGAHNIQQIFADEKYLYVHTNNIVPKESNYLHKLYSMEEHIQRSFKDLRIPAWYKKGDLGQPIVLPRNSDKEQECLSMPENSLTLAGITVGELEKNGFEPVHQEDIFGALSSALIPVDLYEFNNLFFNNHYKKMHIIDPCFAFYKDIMLIPGELELRWLKFEPFQNQVLVSFKKDASDYEPSFQMAIKNNKIYSAEQFREKGLMSESDKQKAFETQERRNKLIIFQNTSNLGFQNGEGRLSANSSIIKRKIEVNSNYEEHTSPGILGTYTNGDTFYVLTNTWVYGSEMKPTTIVESPNKLLKFKITSNNPELEEIISSK